MKKLTLTEQFLFICVSIIVIVIISLGMVLPKTLLPVYEENLYNYLNQSLNLLEKPENNRVDSEVAYIYIDGDKNILVSSNLSDVVNIKDVKVIGVEPLSSPVISQNKRGSHKIQGIGAGFIPSTLNLNIIDKVETCSDEDAFTFARIVPSIEGMLVGISSGASLKVAIDYAKKEENTNKIETL